MNRLVMAIFVLLLPASAFSGTSKHMTAVEKNAVTIIKPKIKQLMQKNHIPGVAIALVNSKGILWTQGFGYTDTQHSYRVTPNTLFSVQSQSKMISTIGVLIAVEKGWLNLNNKISNYLPELKARARNTKNPVEQMTLKELLSHTAGFTHDAPIGNNNNAKPPYQAHINSILEGTWLKFIPGTDYSYSNVGIELAGHILQNQVNLSFAEYMQKYLFKPLDMQHSTYDVRKVLRVKDRAKGTIIGLKQTPINYSMVAPAALYSTAIDMGHYLKFQLNQGQYHHKSVLGKEYINLMRTIPIPKPGQISGMALGLWKGVRHHDIYYGHLGRGFGFSSITIWYPAYHIGVTVLTNKYGSDSDIAIANDLLDYIIKAHKAKELSQLTPKIIGQYVSNNFFGINFSISKSSMGLAIKGFLNYGIGGNIIKRGVFPLTYEGQAIFYNKADQQRYRYATHSATGVPTLTRIKDGATFYYNDGPNDKPGPALKRWHKYVGTYLLPSYGNPERLQVHIKNGYLYLNHFRLHEYKPGAFFTANGNPLILIKGDASWNNIKIYRKKDNGTSLINQ